jgi:sterol desaturase/sphingolipid hydroxylase (fatty acid hydroxylase superfamily)
VASGVESQLQALALSALRLCAWLLLLSAIFLPLERAFAVQPRRFLRRGLGQDIAWFFINGLVPSVLLALPLTLVAAAAHAIMPAGLQSAVAGWPLWERIVAGLVIGEIGFYWGHRWAHEIPFLWRFHAIHHGAEEIYFLVSARAHPVDNAFIRLCGLIPAVVLGVASPLAPTGSLVPVLIVLVATAWGFFIHANLRWRWGPLESIVSTPAFHHWHHVRDQRRDCNFASMLPWVDRLFGTWHVPRREWPMAYGVEEPLPTGLVGQLLHPFRLASKDASHRGSLAEETGHDDMDRHQPGRLG